MIPISDLRKGNLVQTNHGILPVHHLVFSDVYVLGKDQRVLYALEVDGIPATKENMAEYFGFEPTNWNNIHDAMIFAGYLIFKSGNKWMIEHTYTKFEFIHELQNIYYWTRREELKLKLNEPNRKVPTQSI